MLLDKVSERKRKKGERLIESQNIESEKLLSQQKTEREDLESSQVIQTNELCLYVKIIRLYSWWMLRNLL